MNEDAIDAAVKEWIARHGIVAHIDDRAALVKIIQRLCLRSALEAVEKTLTHVESAVCGMQGLPEDILGVPYDQDRPSDR